jgi:hypothetical protein
VAVPPRGIYNPLEPDEGFALAAAAVLDYKFHDEDLMEEELESAGSGVRVLGRSKRVCEMGNRELMGMGRRLWGLC